MKLLISQLFVLSLHEVASYSGVSSNHHPIRSDSINKLEKTERDVLARDDHEDLFWNVYGTPQNGGQPNEMTGSDVSLCEDGSYMVVGSHTGVVLYRYNDAIEDWEEAYDFTDDLLQNRQFYYYRAVISDNCENVIIGAPGSDEKGYDAGGAQVFVKDMSLSKRDGPESWTQYGESLFGERLEELFGFAVDISEDGKYILIGAPGADYVENWESLDHVESWQERITLTGTAGDYFGNAVSISGDGNRGIVGAPLGGALGQNGYVRIVSLVDQSFVSRTNGQNAGAQIGQAVDMSRDGSTVAFSSVINGHVIVFELNTVESAWQKVGVSICVEDEAFGSDVSLSKDGSCVAIGAPDNNFYGPQAGKAYVYQKLDEWTLVGEEQYGTSSFDSFGSAVSLASNKEKWAVGAPERDDNRTDSGQVTVYCNVEPTISPTMMPTQRPTKAPTKQPTIADPISFTSNLPTTSAPTSAPTRGPSGILQLILGLLSLLISFCLGLLFGGLNIIGSSCGLCAYYFCGDLTYWFGGTFCGYYCCGDWGYWFYNDPTAGVGAEVGVEVVGTSTEVTETGEVVSSA